jgi:3-deoxy-manno-octulosonate cytidylyltransferase (CMP-KDO synthetase)
MKVICIIPSRISSTRIPRKPLALIAGKPLVIRTFEAAQRCIDINKVVVATDSNEIAEVIYQAGGEAVMSPAELPTGSDRVAFVSEQFPEYDVVVNLQGDEPFMQASMLSSLIQPFKKDDSVNMATLGSPLNFEKQHSDPNIVKVIYDCKGDAIYFSRSPIPYFRQPSKNVNVLHHMGVYGFRREFLKQYTKMPQTPLEIAESLEQLRVLEHGYKIRVCKVPQRTLEINTPEELEQAQAWAAAE